MVSDLEINEAILKGLADGIDDAFKEAYKDEVAFAILIFDPKIPQVGQYISNVDREPMIIALRETANRLEKNQVIPPALGEA